MKKLIIIGASGHGKVIADIASQCGYSELTFLDDNDSIKSCMGYPVIGKSSEISKQIDAEFFVGIGNPDAREKVQREIVRQGLCLATLIHPKAVVAKTVSIGKGTVVMAGVVINSDTKIGEGCIINTASSVDHDNVLDDYVHVSIGSHLSGTVHVGKGTWIGAGAVVSNNVDICGNCMIGAGAVVVKNITIPGIYVGVPAKRVDKMSKHITSETMRGGGISK